MTRVIIPPVCPGYSEDAYGFNSGEQWIESPAQGEHPTLISWLKAWALELD